MGRNGSLWALRSARRRSDGCDVRPVDSTVDSPCRFPLSKLGREKNQGEAIPPVDSPRPSKLSLRTKILINRFPPSMPPNDYRPCFPFHFYNLKDPPLEKQDVSRSKTALSRTKTAQEARLLEKQDR